MVFKIRTSKKTEELFKLIEASENLQPYALSKLAISLSIKSESALEESDFHTDNNGLELNRQTITGEYDELYKCLVAMKEQRHIDDDEYFQKYIKAHLDRGAKILYSEFYGCFVDPLYSFHSSSTRPRGTRFTFVTPVCSDTVQSAETSFAASSVIRTQRL